MVITFRDMLDYTTFYLKMSIIRWNNASRVYNSLKNVMIQVFMNISHQHHRFEVRNNPKHEHLLKTFNDRARAQNLMKNDARFYGKWLSMSTRY